MSCKNLHDMKIALVNIVYSVIYVKYIYFKNYCFYVLFFMFWWASHYAFGHSPKIPYGLMKNNTVLMIFRILP